MSDKFSIKNKKDLTVKIDSHISYRDEFTQIDREIGMMKINDSLYLGICSESARKKFILHIPPGLFDTVACLSMLTKDNITWSPQTNDYDIVGDIPSPDKKITKTDVIMKYNEETLLDYSESWVDFQRQLPRLLDITDSYVALSTRGRVLVLINCAAGIRRACAMGMALLMKTCHIDAEDSFKKIREVRPAVDPPYSFICVLSQYFPIIQ